MNKKLIKRNPLILDEPVLSTAEDFIRFLKILQDKKQKGFLSLAAKVYHVSLSTVQRRLSSNPEFKMAVDSVRQAWHQRRLDQLERLSFDESLKTENVRERLFQLQAHDPAKYRNDRNSVAVGAIQVSFGYTIPEVRYGMNDKIPRDEDVQDVEIVEEVESPDHGITDLDVEDI